MTQAARVYGGSLYDLATEEKLDGQIMEQMNEIRQIFRENPGYLKLLGEPAIPQEERIKLLDEAFGGQVEPYLLNFLKLLCEKKILREFSGCCEEFTRRYNADHGIVEHLLLLHTAECNGSILTHPLYLHEGRNDPVQMYRHLRQMLLHHYL